MTDYMLPFQPSLAQGTNTRLDSACKHIQQCRVSTDDMTRFVLEDNEELQRNKYRYCIHKDEMVVGLGRPDSGASVKRIGNAAYPRVVSNLGGLKDTAPTCVAIDMIRFMNHYARSISERKYIIDFFKRGVHGPATFLNDLGATVTLPEGSQAFKARGGGTGMMSTRDFMSMMHDYFTVGYANTLGYAHPNSGDTMTSVMIGGLRTVMNGDFEMFAGDLVQFYWCFEKDDFESNGRRKPYLNIWSGANIPGNVDPSITEAGIGGSRKRGPDGDRESWSMPPDAQIRQANYNLSYGQKPDKMKVVAMIKPYLPDEENPRLNDWYRVFGIAIASARPNEMCDIKISRQSM